MTAAWWEGDLVGFDLETTGVDPETARIVTACVVLDIPGHEPVVRSWLVNPGVDIPAEAAAVHGVTTERAQADGQYPDVAIGEILTLLGAQANPPLVAFNAAYDFTVLDREARRLGREPFAPRPVIDPFVIDKQVDRYRRGKRTLGVTCQHYGVTLDAAHTADADALAAVQLARAIARGTSGAPDVDVLHDLQIGWRAQQSASLQDYLRRQDPTVVVDGTWPVHPHTP